MNDLKEKIAALVGLEAVTKHAYIITIGTYQLQIQGDYSEEAVTEVRNAGGEFHKMWSSGETEYHKYNCLVNGIVVDITLCKR